VRSAILITVIINKRPVEIHGRAAAMIKFLVSQWEQINGAPTLTVEHNCAGRKVQSKLHFYETETMMVD